jgi:hypothetical protein
VSLLIVLFFRIELWQGGVKYEYDKLAIVIMCVQRLFQTSLLVRVSGLKNIINALRFLPFLITQSLNHSIILTYLYTTSSVLLAHSIENVFSFVDFFRQTVEVVNDIIKEKFSSYPMKVLIPCICRTCQEIHMKVKDVSLDIICDTPVFSLEECENAVARGT